VITYDRAAVSGLGSMSVAGGNGGTGHGTGAAGTAGSAGQVIEQLVA